MDATSAAWGITNGIGAQDFLIFPLPDFNPVVFQNCTVGNASTDISLTGGNVSSMLETYNGNEVVVAEGFVDHPGAFLVLPTVLQAAGRKGREEPVRNLQSSAGGR